METLIHLLYLEDDPFDAELVQATLAEANLTFRTTMARTREEYEAALQNSGADIILADYKLPMFDGMSALLMAREQCPEIPFIFVSGTMGEEAAIMALTQGATDYVLKHNLSRLASAVERALQEARTLRERRQAQEALQRSNEMLRAIIEAAPVAIIGLDLDGHVHSVWNPAAEKMLGWSAQDAMGRRLPSVPADDETEFKRFRQQIRSGMTLEGVEVGRQRRDGSPIDYSIYASPLHDSHGRVNGNIAVLVDITERKRTEIRLNEQLHFLQQLLDSIPIPVYYKDTKGLYLGCNAAFEEFIGLTRKEIIGKTVHDVVIKERADRHYKADADLLAQTGKQIYEVGGIQKDDQVRDVIFYKATFVDANQCVAGTVGALMDITERKQAERDRLANLKFFENMDKINQAIQGAGDLEQMMHRVLDAVIKVFNCDKTQLIYPCNPDADAWMVQMECNQPGCKGMAPLNKKIAMTPEVAEMHRISRSKDRPVVFGAGTDLPLTPEQVASGDQSGITMAVYPKNTDAWGFSMEQCSHPRIWTRQEIRLFDAIGRRLADGLTSLLSYRDLHTNEEFLDNVVEHIPNMLFVKDAKTLKFIRFNKAGEELLGYSRKELLGKTDHDLFPQTVADFFTAKDRQVIACREFVDIPEETILTSNQEERILHTKKIPILDETGSPQYLLGISEDITTYKEAEASIRKLSQVVEQSPVSIIITDVDGKIEFVNARFTDITGYTLDEVVGRNPKILKSGQTPAETYTNLWGTIKSGGIWRGELKNRNKDGELFWEQATIAPVRDAANVITHFVAVKEDISERKRLEDLLRQVQKMEAIGQLAGGIAHDFNNILSAITGYTEISRSIIDPESEVSEYLSHVLEASGRAKELINQILMFSRETEQELRPIQICLPVKEALKLIRASVPANIEISSTIDSQASALADPTQIHQIVMNLCTNAAQAMQESGGLLDVRMTDIIINGADSRKNYPDAKEGEYIKLTVSDQGYGIETHHIHRIFDPFFTTKEKGKGTGMGLSVVHGIVKSYGGMIYVHSQPSKGSSFEILIPALEGEAPKDTALQIPIPTGSESILFVDDETMLADIAKGMLESLGYRVAIRTSAAEALEAFRNNPDLYDLVITDLIMPKMSGLELTEKILQLRPNFPIVLCTGFGINMTEEDVCKYGVRSIVYKPILRRDMAAVVRNTLDNR